MFEQDRLRERIRQLIKDAGETQTSVAAKLGYASGKMSKILSGADGRSVRINHLEDIAKVLGN